jgi:hypothetical protein
VVVIAVVPEIIVIPEPAAPVPIVVAVVAVVVVVEAALGAVAALVVLGARGGVAAAVGALRRLRGALRVELRDLQLRVQVVDVLVDRVEVLLDFVPVRLRELLLAVLENVVVEGLSKIRRESPYFIEVNASLRASEVLVIQRSCELKPTGLLQFFLEKLINFLKPFLNLAMRLGEALLCYIVYVSLVDKFGTSRRTRVAGCP